MTQNRLAPYKKLLFAAGVIQYCLSLTILLLASTNDIATFPVWVGAVDVGLVLTLFVTMILLKTAVGWQNTAESTRQSYAVFTYLIPLLIVAIWVFREQVLLNTLLPGLAWRLYVLFEGLPPSLTLFSKPKP